MKKTLLFVLGGLFLLSACSEEFVGQTPIDSDAPSSVSDVIVENQPGGAKIFYTLPQETDISYVRAEYMYKGSMATTKSSVYQNFVLLEGFGSEDPVNVKLFTVDHSGNNSQPVDVTINPLLPPVYEITQSFEWERDFGGFKLTWHNSTGNEVVLTLLVKAEDGIYYEEEVCYTSAKNGEYNFRGLADVPTDFGLFVRDKFYNYSDTVKFNLTPIREVEIPSDDFARVTDIPTDNQSTYWGWLFENMWNDVVGDEGWHTMDANNGKLPLYWTIDMGMKVKLSRFTIWHRTGVPYAHQNLKKFVVYACNEYEKGKDNAYYNKGGDWETDGHWYYIGTFEIKKPSGLPVGTTSEDIEAMNAGFSFNVPLDIPAIRYVRFGMLSNFSGGTDLHISEIKFYGDDTAE